MDPGTTDRRVRRTRQLLRNALLSLILEKGYEHITIQDILDRADVGRSTFYAHFRDKDDLLLSGFQDIHAAIATESGDADKGAKRNSEFLQPMLVVFRHVEQHRQLKAMAKTDMVVRALRQGVTELVRDHFRSEFRGWNGDQTQLEAAVQFVVSALMGLLIWWLEAEVPYSAEEIHAVFRRLTTQGVRRFLAAT